MKSLNLFALLLLLTITAYAQVPRKVLHEYFSGSNCGPCAPAGDSVMNVLHQNENNYTIVKYPLGSDPYYTAEGVNRISYYQGGGSYSIPYMSVDGNSFKPNDVNGDGIYGPHPVGCTYCNTQGIPGNGCPNWSGDNYAQPDFDQYYTAPSYLELDVSQSVSGQTVDIDVGIIAHDSLLGVLNKLHVIIMENTTYNNIGTNGQTEFHYVMKKFVPNQSGTTIGDINDGDSLQYTLSYTFNGVYNDTTQYGDPVDHSIEHTIEEFSDLSVVAFVQNHVTKEVYQSEWTYITASVDSWNCDLVTGCYDPGNGSGTYNSLADCEAACNTTGLKNKTKEFFSAYPNPSNSLLSIDYFIQNKKEITVSMYNLMGERVMKKVLGEQIPGTYHTIVNVSNFSPGIYMVELLSGRKKVSQTVIVN